MLRCRPPRLKHWQELPQEDVVHPMQGFVEEAIAMGASIRCGREGTGKGKDVADLRETHWRDLIDVDFRHLQSDHLGPHQMCQVQSQNDRHRSQK
eukprot:CAMPEP_0178447126 /NCGR_PEP_ID=MMETSP0689_2-20121128/41206_1 /TAXON_ID=160604 /ORGANISM="Amphidinium massartii, Strain CS-259" /LENGTH=94 /DNA_ID=CAMNT_0020072067 /DNA_START=396 /DNA_END=677 /DNA_ORIENTATION=+